MQSSPGLTVALTTALATTPEINKSGYRRGIVFIPTGETLVTLTYNAAPKLSADGGTYLPLQTIAGVASTQTVAGGKCYEVPSEVGAASFIRVQANAAGTVHFQWSD